MSAGSSRVNLPAGQALLRVEHGLEYERFKEVIDITDGTTTKTITLPRWVNMKNHGYACGENHLHVGPEKLAPMLTAEGLDFGTSLTWFNGPEGGHPVPDGEGKERNLRFGNHSVPTSIYDAELEYGWGAAYIQNLQAPLPLVSDRQRPNLDYLKHAVAEGAMVHYQAGWSREVCVDALLGLVHSVNVCNNNFHMHRYQQRSRYSNLLNVPGFPAYPNTEEGMMRMNTDTYYRLLNWGLRLAAGAGSATGVKQSPAGYNRAYVRLQPDADIDAFYQHWMAGQNFVTNGPILLFHTADNSRPGDTIALPDEGATIKVHLTVLTGPAQTLENIEIIVNGEVSATIPVSDPHHASGEATVTIHRGAWIAARCTAEDKLLSDEELAVFSEGSDESRYRMRPSRLRFAHTSPIYITVGGRNAAVRTSIEEGLQMLKQFNVYARDAASVEHLPDIQSAIDQARRKLNARLADAPSK